MAYSVKYIFKVATQSGVIMNVELLEDGYTGSPLNYLVTGTCNMQWIPSSDDPFEPIIASQLSVSIDVTDDIVTMPDLVTLNDRKYQCKFKEGTTVIWTGWVLSDSVQVPFTSGLREISFSAICGLGMLAYITYQATNYNTLLKYSLKDIIVNCLGQLQFDTNLNIFTACSLYATSMNDRADAAANEPFAQTYISYNSIQDNGAFKTCQQILRDIFISFGCRIIQANGEWNVLQVNQQANSTNYYTRYSNTGTVVNSGTYNNRKNIPTNGVFIGNSQLKILQKGFNRIISNNPINYNDNLLYNGDFKIRVPEIPGDPRFDIPDGWDTDFTVNNVNWAGMTKAYTGSYDVVALVGGPGTANLTYDGSIFVNEYEEIVLSLIPYSSTPVTIDGVNFELRIALNTPTGTYYYNNIGTEDWQGPVIPPISTWFNATALPTNRQWTLNLKPAPAKGQLVISFWKKAGDTGSIGLGNINLKVNNQISSINITAKISDAYSYNKEVSIPFGIAPKVDGKYQFNGYLSDSAGVMLTDWYMMERPTDKYYSLAELTIKNISNLFLKNIVNVDSTIELYNVRGNEVVEFTDIDPAQISTQGKSYLFGSNTYQYNVQELQGTLLEISNVNNTSTVISQEDVYPQLAIPPFYVRKISPPVNTQTEACALPPFPTTVYFKYIQPLVGEYVYTDSRFLNIFNGNQKYFGIFLEEQFRTGYIRIDTDGRIMDYGMC
jgi:hypothetical protein